MTNELAIRILTGSVLGTEEQTQEAVTMAVKALSMPSAQPEADEVARDIATIIENEKDMRVIRENAEQKWIPCSERLPEEYGNYLATMDDGDVQECSYSPEKDKPYFRGGWSTCDADGITFLDIAEVVAWKTMPKPYKGEEEN